MGQGPISLCRLVPCRANSHQLNKREPGLLHWALSSCREERQLQLCSGQ